MYLFIDWDVTVSPNVSKTIRGADLKIFLDLCFERSQYFSLKTIDMAVLASQGLREELKPFMVKQFHTEKWFGYNCSPDPLLPLDPLEPPDKPIEIQIYNANPDTKKILFNYIFEIFMYEDMNGDKFQTIEDLEVFQDLCFISNNHLFVGTVSHESILAVNTSDAAFIDAIKKLGEWTYEEDNSSFPFLDQEIIV